MSRIHAKTTDYSPDVLAIVATYVWWKSPEEALEFPRHVLAQIMNLATWEDSMKMLDVFGDEAFRDALQYSPPGLIEPKSWVFWHCWFDLEIPKLPKRVIK